MGSILSHSTLHAMLLFFGSYEQHCTQLHIERITRCYNMDMLRVLLTYPNSPMPSRVMHIISVKPLAAMLLTFLFDLRCENVAVKAKTMVM